MVFLLQYNTRSPPVLQEVGLCHKGLRSAGTLVLGIKVYITKRFRAMTFGLGLLACKTESGVNKVYQKPPVSQAVFVSDSNLVCAEIDYQGIIIIHIKLLL